MKRFVKSNIVLLAVLGVAGVIALGLLVFAVIEFSHMLEAKNKTEEFREKVDALHQKHPSPAEENLARLEADSKFYQKKTADLSDRFGRVFAKPLKEFFAALGYSENDFYEKINEIWNNTHNRDTVAGRYVFTSNVKLAFPKWAAAQRAFSAAAKDCTAEEITRKNEEAILFGALGLKRDLSEKPYECLAYMQQMHSMIVNKLDKVAGKDELDELKMSDLSLKYDDKTMPLQEDIVNLVKNYEIISDIAACIGESGVKRFKNLTIRTLAPKEENGFLRYHYTFSVVGDLASIRKLAELLNLRVERNRTYIVQSIFLYNDRLKNLTRREVLRVADPFMVMPPPGEENRGGMHGGRRMNGMRSEPSFRDTLGGPDKKFSPEELKLIEEFERKQKSRTEYGRDLLGGNEFRAVFDVEYVELAGKELK